MSGVRACSRDYRSLQVEHGDRPHNLSAHTDMQSDMQAQRAAGTSLMQPQEKGNEQGLTTAQLGSEAFAALAESSIAPENIFFHKFYQVFCVLKRTVGTPSCVETKKRLALCFGNSSSPLRHTRCSGVQALSARSGPYHVAVGGHAKVAFMVT